jgi:ABC-type multidrug transport system ATPase subunit
VACERVIVLAGGRLVFDGPPAELTGAARGRVWEARLPADEIGRLPPSARVTDQVPEADGRARLRILHDEPPHPEARQVEPTLEEGYLVLVGEQAA